MSLILILIRCSIGLYDGFEAVKSFEKLQEQKNRSGYLL